MLHSLDTIVAAAVEDEAGVLAVAAAHDRAVLEAVVIARRSEIITPILVGDEERIVRYLRELEDDPANYEIIPAQGDLECARVAVQLVTEGKADFLMKGIIGTADLMRAVLSKDANLRTNRLLSHIMLFEAKQYHKLILMTDGGMNTFPDLGKKVQILENAAHVLQCLGYDHINCSCVCGAETVNPKIQGTVDAAAMAAMKEHWAPYHMDVIGPTSVDLALSPEACKHKHYSAPGAGDADILLVTNYEMGNGIYKTALCLGGARSAGMVVGARTPIILVSRSDSAESKLASIALGAIVSRAERQMSGQ